MRTAFSANIKERRDYSCAIFNKNAEMIAQAAHIPVHLGSMQLSVAAAIKEQSFSKGDMIVLNDPYQGGTHLPDITLIAPVFDSEKGLVAYVANRAHHADIGGMHPGSMPLSETIFQEGLILPPLKLMEKGRFNDTLLTLLLGNVRTPGERQGDIQAQTMANLTGIKRYKELIQTCTLERVNQYAKALIHYSEKAMRETIRKIPDGRYAFEDCIDDDGFGHTRVSIRVVIVIEDDSAHFDFRDSDPQVRGALNAVHAITLSAVVYVMRSLMPHDIPTNAGIFQPINVTTRKGTIVDAEFPAAVAGGNVETAQRVVDVLLGALAKVIPQKIPAASQGTMNNITFGSIATDNRPPFTHYETIGGGMGAGFQYDGASAVHSHMTNTLNTPIEAFEYSFPIRIRQYHIRKGSGGKGRYRGGDGIVREYEILAPAEVTVISERRNNPPYGLNGGEPGKTGNNLVYQNGQYQQRPAKFSEILNRGDRIRIETPGGGGWGRNDKST